MATAGTKYFQAFWGLKPKQIRPTVILSPTIYPNKLAGLIGEKISVEKSILGYFAADFKVCTYIKTPMMQGAVGDAITLLKKTACRQIIFIGGLGGLQPGMKIGDIILTNNPDHVYSFSSIHEETRPKLLSLKRRKVLGIDFESQVFFTASKKSGLSAKAYYVLTDLPLTKPFYEPRTEGEEAVIADSISQILRKISSELK